MVDDILEEMITAGCSAILIAKVAGLITEYKVLCAREDARKLVEQRDQSRRDANAARQRKWRKSRVDVTVTSTSRLHNVTVTSTPTQAIDSTVKIDGRVDVTGVSCEKPAYIHTKQVSKKESKYICHKSALPPDWVLSEKGGAFAKAKGLSEERITSEAERFKDHALANGRRQVDWEAAWRSWVNSPLQKRGMNGATAAPPRPGSRDDIRERNADAYRQLCDWVDANSNDKGGSGGDCEATFGFLSSPQCARS